MTSIERRALLGDAEAQRKCTEKGIVLGCPCCGEKKVDTLETKYYGLVQCMECGLSMAAAYLTCALARWNRRPAPPIGRCVECKHGIPYKDNHIMCKGRWADKDYNGFCNDFEPKED